MQTYISTELFGKETIALFQEDREGGEVGKRDEGFLCCMQEKYQSNFKNLCFRIKSPIHFWEFLPPSLPWALFSDSFI